MEINKSEFVKSAVMEKDFHLLEDQMLESLRL